VAWLFARSAGARFLVRIEDLDPDRVREEFVRSQLDDLRALGLDWDGDPVRQSQRTHLYAAALAGLKAQGLVYRCFCSRREIREAASAQHGPDAALVYPGTCSHLTPEESERRALAGDPFALRLRADNQHVEVADRLHGPFAATVDDIVLVRRDGAFAYNLAVVVDDDAQCIREVVRGDDLLDATPAQAHLYDVLGLDRPSWAHVPLVLGPEGRRLAKRDGAVTLRERAERGETPADVLLSLAGSLGLAEPGERVTARELVGRFDPAALPREPLVIEPA
jgi:glutamyl-tRNA synthetase